ncbi:aspartyl-phosphate phosphatase Spo0E family protein [Paenibacillus lautus]|uniref:aspartyl-phosphate phosphatase Spo0E family protein n=1 Tax=Paenibacillus lautus TaxID=1401 RepID=UPI002DBE3E9D|nr:aspartyl-phosphate phosphatase Spo0E family protein [Paenibacillus lautus]MEC0259355.1 aspartyl-phosphate phosphatase Spo0E family protein [Paenibacillus lautus]
MRENAELKKKIEKKRQALNQIAKRFGVLDQRTLKKSEELDRIVNEYIQLKH